MSEFLELSEFFEADGEAEVDVRSGGIDAKLHVEGASEAEFGEEFVVRENLCGTAAESFELGFGSLHEEDENGPLM